MGYYTSYNLTLECSNPDRVKEVERALIVECVKSEDDLDQSLVELLDTGAVYAKLYDLDTWIANIAPKFPDVLFILEGSGEEQDDMWEKRWRGAAYEEQRAAIPPFTNKELLTKTEKSNN